MSVDTEPPFRGVGVALATLFRDDLQVDVDATARHARKLVDAGVRAVIVCGTTAEPETLDAAERLAILDGVLDAVGAEVPVVMGASLPSGFQSAAFAAEVADRKVSAVLARSPRRVLDPTAFYNEVSQAIGDVPLLAYHFPAVAPPGIPLDTLPALPVVGLKDSSGSAERLLATLDVFDGHLYTGAAPLAFSAGQFGCTGAILALANACPEVCLKAFDGDVSAQRELMPSHMSASSGFPDGLKSLMAENFGTPRATRLH